jgi:hypothetical protein
MRIRLSMNLFLLGAFGLIAGIDVAFAQRIIPDRAGATEAVTDRRSNIGLILDTSFSSETSFVREFLFAPGTDRDISQVSPTLSGELVTRRFSAYVSVPYIFSLGMVPMRLPLPDLYEFKLNSGAGDIRAGAVANLLAQGTGDGPSPLNLNISFDVLAPTGESRFETDSLPLGNGFWNLSYGVGVSRALNHKMLVFANGGEVKRVARTFADKQRNSTPLTLRPDEVRFARAGVGFVMKQSLLNIEVEQTLVGAVHPRESEFRVMRLGTKSVVNRNHGLTGSIFAGVEFVGSNKRAVFSFAVPMLRIVGIDF